MTKSTLHVGHDIYVFQHHGKSHMYMYADMFTIYGAFVFVGGQLFKFAFGRQLFYTTLATPLSSAIIYEHQKKLKQGNNTGKRAPHKESKLANRPHTEIKATITFIWKNK